MWFRARRYSPLPLNSFQKQLCGRFVTGLIRLSRGIDLSQSARNILFLLASLTLASAEGTRTWEQSKFEDLAKGTARGVAIRSNGGIELAPAFKARMLAGLWTGLGTVLGATVVVSGIVLMLKPLSKTDWIGPIVDKVISALENRGGVRPHRNETPVENPKSTPGQGNNSPIDFPPDDSSL